MFKFQQQIKSLNEESMKQVMQWKLRSGPHSTGFCSLEGHINFVNNQYRQRKNHYHNQHQFNNFQRSNNSNVLDSFSHINNIIKTNSYNKIVRNIEHKNLRRHSTNSWRCRWITKRIQTFQSRLYTTCLIIKIEPSLLNRIY